MAKLPFWQGRGGSPGPSLPDWQGLLPEWRGCGGWGAATPTGSGKIRARVSGARAMGDPEPSGQGGRRSTPWSPPRPGCLGSAGFKPDRCFGTTRIRDAYQMESGPPAADRDRLAIGDVARDEREAGGRRTPIGRTRRALRPSKRPGPTALPRPQATDQIRRPFLRSCGYKGEVGIKSRPPVNRQHRSGLRTESTSRSVTHDNSLSSPEVARTPSVGRVVAHARSIGAELELRRSRSANSVRRTPGKPGLQ